LLSNVGKLFTASRLLSLIGLKSKSTLLEYLSHLEDAYLCFYLPKYSPSSRKQLVNPRKIYVVDPGIVQANSGSMLEDLGRKLENLVYLALRRLSADLFYFSDKHDCDFVLVKQGQCQQLVQVCYEVTPENLDREVNGLLEAMDYFGLKTGTIVTFNQNDQLSYDQGSIDLVEAHNWLQLLEAHPSKS
jgi:predicted AAA+ superfamily ATPase